MEKQDIKAEKIFLVFGVLTIFAGIGIITSDDYLLGISGAIVGIGLTLDNWKKIKNAKANNVES